VSRETIKEGIFNLLRSGDAPETCDTAFVVCSSGVQVL